MKNFMKLSSFLLALLAIAWLASSCGKEEKPQDAHSNCLVPLETGSKDASYLLITSMGHDGKNCPGCVLVNGRLRHVDCQGAGSECLKSPCVSLQQVGADLVATTVDTFGLTSEDFFNMPARSLNYVDEDNNRVFLNIPAQLVYRDTATLQFSFTGLSITSGPLYEND
jgi:hypothetical protein